MVPCIEFDNFDSIYKTHEWGFSRECFNVSGSLYVYFFSIKANQVIEKLPKGIYVLDAGSLFLTFGKEITQIKSSKTKTKNFSIDDDFILPATIVANKETVHIYGFFSQKQIWLIPTKIKT